MLNRIITFLSLLIFSSQNVMAQDTDKHHNYKPVYPISEDANICYKTSYLTSEKILFEANPVVRYSFSNNILKTLVDENVTKSSRAKDRSHAYYVAFKPQLRMYQEQSEPVKMPTYLVEFGTQQAFRANNDRDLFTVSLESGHYSNGQAGCAFDSTLRDETPESNAVLGSIKDHHNLSAMLNRRDGNFSTNITELNVNYRINYADNRHEHHTLHSFRLGLVVYHNLFFGIFDFGGYTGIEIKIYGRARWQAGYELVHVFRRGTRIALQQTVELIPRAHKSVNPWRSETSVTYYPIKSFSDFGAFGSFIAGHDNYNYRFVDAGTQLAIGVKWAFFAPSRVANRMHEKIHLEESSSAPEEKHLYNKQDYDYK